MRNRIFGDQPSRVTMILSGDGGPRHTGTQVTRLKAVLGAPGADSCPAIPLSVPHAC
jgi:hypothetical protein